MKAAKIKMIQVRNGGKHRIWNASIKDNTVCSTWGRHKGKAQTTTVEYQTLNKGKKNEKSPERVAEEDFARKVKLKMREGFVEWDGENTPEILSAIDPRAPLPESTRFWKPQNTLNKTMIRATEHTDSVVYVRKREGEAFFIQALGNRKYIMYSRTMQQTFKDEPNIPWLTRFPYLHMALEQIDLCAGSIFGIELIASNKQDKDNFTLLSKITSSLTKEALKIQKEHSWPIRAYVWGVMYLSGQLPEMDMISLTLQLEDMFSADSTGVLLPPEIHRFDSTEVALDKAEVFKYEGWVVHDLRKDLGNKLYTLTGKTPRPSSIAKLKPEGEDDFIIMWDPEKKVGTYGTGKNKSLPGSVGLFQYNTQGALVYLGNCGNFTDAMRKKLGDRKLYPFVWKVRYKERKYKANGNPNNSVIQPKYDSVRKDKAPEECLNDLLDIL